MSTGREITGSYISGLYMVEGDDSHLTKPVGALTHLPSLETKATSRGA
jgi:hypothetical protein